ncbi:hypothetical protein ABK040_013868 [Willaertia magna]
MQEASSPIEKSHNKKVKLERKLHHCIEEQLHVEEDPNNNNKHIYPYEGRRMDDQVLTEEIEIAKKHLNLLNELINGKEKRLELKPDEYFIITGSNTGIGFETAMIFACQFKYNVILACRNEQRGNKAKEDIEKELKRKEINVDVKFMKLDLCSLKSVKDFSNEINNLNIKIKGLINNAGIMIPPLEYTKEGHELQFGCNYLAHFLLTHLLKDNLIKNGPNSRIILVSSEAHKTGYVNFNDFDMKKSIYNPYLGYTQSKMCEIMFCYEFDRILKKEGLNDKLTINVLHPGIIATNIGANILYPFNLIFNHFINLIALTPLEGAINQIYVASSLSLTSVSGKYFKHLREGKSAKETYDEEKCKLLYEKSLELVKDYL